MKEPLTEDLELQHGNGNAGSDVAMSMEMPDVTDESDVASKKVASSRAPPRPSADIALFCCFPGLCCWVPWVFVWGSLILGICISAAITMPDDCEHGTPLKMWLEIYGVGFIVIPLSIQFLLMLFRITKVPHGFDGCCLKAIRWVSLVWIFAFTAWGWLAYARSFEPCASAIGRSPMVALIFLVFQTCILAPLAMCYCCRGKMTEPAQTRLIKKYDREANGLTFSCRESGEGNKKGDVLLLHGFPEWSVMYEPLMLRLADQGYRSVAFDQRGYSLGAAPDDREKYKYDEFVNDVFAVADTFFGFEKKFHLVAHDHGAALGWYIAAKAPDRLLSYTAMAIPHLDVCSRLLWGEESDLDQQVASQYFTILSKADDAAIRLSILFKVIPAAIPNGFVSVAHFQKACWWYWSMFETGVVAMPPLLSACRLLQKGSFIMALVRCSLFPACANEGKAQTKKIGDVKVPVLYVGCARDPYILGTSPLAQKTADYCKLGYMYLGADCEHELDKILKDDSVIKKILERIETAAVRFP